MSDTSIKFTLHVATSENDYPHVSLWRIKDPMDSNDRGDVKKCIQGDIHAIGASDYKLLENFDHFEVRFKHHFDHLHFTEAQGKDWDELFTVAFHVSEDRAKHTSNIRKLKNCFKEVTRNTGLTHRIIVRLDEKAKTVLVQAATMAEYMYFWQHVPTSGRQKLVNYDL